MKKIQIATGLLAFLLADVVAAPSCPGGGGYWDYEVQQVRVCDTVTETYEERHCEYSGFLSALTMHTPIQPFQSHRNFFIKKILNGILSCPQSEFYSESYPYRYKDSQGIIRMGSASFFGHLSLYSNRIETKTRTVETNCRTETKTVPVWRCGMIP